MREPKDVVPPMDITSYKSPVSAGPNLMCVAVLYVTPQECEAIKSFAQQVKNRRGNEGEQSVTISWGQRKVTTTNAFSGEGRIINETVILVDDKPPPGFTSFYNQVARRFEYIGPDDKRYTQALGSYELVRVLPVCANGHILPRGETWCKTCGEQRPGKKAASPKEPEKPLDRFEGLDI